MSGTRWCDNCGWWVVGEHGPDVCGEFKKSAGARTKGCEHTWGRTCPYCRETQLDALLESASVRSAQGDKMLIQDDNNPNKVYTGELPQIGQTDAVHHPAHYGGDTPYEAIKVIEAWGLGFCLGNTVKYISRAGKKSANIIEDLKKADWYLKREIERLEAGQ